MLQTHAPFGSLRFSTTQTATAGKFQRGVLYTLGFVKYWLGPMFGPIGLYGAVACHVSQPYTATLRASSVKTVRTGCCFAKKALRTLFRHFLSVSGHFMVPPGWLLNIPLRDVFFYMFFVRHCKALFFVIRLSLFWAFMSPVLLHQVGGVQVRCAKAP